MPKAPDIEDEELADNERTVMDSDALQKLRERDAERAAAEKAEEAADDAELEALMSPSQVVRVAKDPWSEPSASRPTSEAGAPPEAPSGWTEVGKPKPDWSPSEGSAPGKGADGWGDESQ